MDKTTRGPRWLHSSASPVSEPFLDENSSDARDTPASSILEDEKPASAMPPSGHHYSPSSAKRRVSQRLLYFGQILIFLIVVIQFVLLYRTYTGAGSSSCDLSDFAGAAGIDRKPTDPSAASDIPDYYQTSPQHHAGPTPTGTPAFLAQTNPAPFASTTYIAPQPLETQVPIEGRVGNNNIYQLHGYLSHYFSNPDGFGADEYPLPEDAEIVQLNMLSRHGARYPTAWSGAPEMGEKLTAFLEKEAEGEAFIGELSFLNSWQYLLGAEILVPVGKQELFDSGTLHQYMYGHLYPNDGSKVIARSTTQDRMTKTAEYFLAGFFGLEWTQNATLVLAIEENTYNNTLAGYDNCPNSNRPVSFGGNNATLTWYETYLANATTRLQAQAPGFDWTIADTYNAQSLCAYETVALGYSAFCGLFTYAEWEGYEYSTDLQFAGNSGFQSPTGRAVGIGYVQEILARLQHHTIDTPVAQVNVSLDNNTATFPTNQSLNFDFSHDTNIMSILTAFGFTQFAELLPLDGIPERRELVVAHMEPFAARLDMEVIRTPAPLSGKRSEGTSYEEGGETTYLHFLLNQRTLPMGRSFPECGDREDGWCELETFLKVQEGMLDEAEYERACFGEYEAVEWGGIMDGRPLREGE